MAELAFVDLPGDGIYRAGRWGDVYRFPPPAHAVALEQAAVLDGYRWEDALGQFSTLKFSRAPEGAIGRTLTRYRKREIEPGFSVIDTFKRYFTHEPDEGEPELTEGQVPEDYFDDAHLLRLQKGSQRSSDILRFIDLDDAQTHRVLEAIAGAVLERFGVSSVDHDIVNHRDRRVTRTITRELYDHRTDAPELENVVGVHYRGEHAEWDAFVIWQRTSGPDLVAQPDVFVRPILPGDRDLLAAAERIGVELPGT